MKFREINCKTKEFYYNVKPLQEGESLIASRFAFWASMNHIAMQNMMVQQLKRE